VPRGAHRPAEGGEVRLLEEHAGIVDPLDGVLVQFGAVGRVVEHHDDAGGRLGHERHQVRERHEPAAVAGDEHGGAVRPCRRGAHGRGGAEADGLERRPHEDEFARVTDPGMLRHPSDELPAVVHERPAGRQEIIEPPGHQPGIEPAVGGVLGDPGEVRAQVLRSVRGAVPPRAAGRGRRGAVVQCAEESVGERSRVRPDKPGDPGMGDRLGVHPDDLTGVGEEAALPILEVVEPDPDREHHVRRGDQLPRPR